ncbi:Metallo-dependent phosphatase-like protein [Aspergillus flavus]|uniref:Metallo-dependent phosphatase-like protein n=1 Tax=Aspergillus flavus TaxID=5059 RepID=A0A5N6HGD0_ASPFL|nr:Metallo-dependent phosphatase-like protein [Aspergillus flavus]
MSPTIIETRIYNIYQFIYFVKHSKISRDQRTRDSAHHISYNVSICMPGQTNFTGYRNHFRMPSPQSGGVGNFVFVRQWYARKDLSAVDRNKTPWIIAVAAGHRPWYISAKNESGTVCEDCRKVFEPIFLKHGVDLVLSGHTHLYERNAPIRTFNADPNGLNNPSAPCKLTFHNCTHLTHDFISNSNGTVLDTATLFKKRECGSKP